MSYFIWRMKYDIYALC